MPVVGEEETRPKVSNGDDIATEDAERALEAGFVEVLVEGANSDEQKSHHSDSHSDAGSGRGGNRRLPPLLGDFDVLRFKNRFLEVVEELRMRRVIDTENEERIKSLVTEKHDLQQKLEEANANCEALIEGHIHDEQELRKSSREQLKQAEDDVARNRLTAESKEQELKALKDEIRSLHLSRYNLEKKVQEQERQLHVQSSSRENYLTQVNQLEQNCLSVSKQASEVTEHVERLQANVKKAMELHKKLEYVNEHQQCELKQCQGQLEQCRRELLEARVKVNSDRDGVLQSRGEKKCNSQELRIQVELNRQLQDQLSTLREEHQSTIQQLKEAHSVVDRHIESSAKLSANEMVMEEELKELKESNEDLQQKLSAAEEMCDSAVESHSREIVKSNETCCDLEQRLKALQIDYAALQSSHDKLEEEKVAGEREGQAMREDLEMLRDKLKKAGEEMANLHKDKESVSEELKQFKLSLEHQLANQKLLTEKSENEPHHSVEVTPKSLVVEASPSTTVKLEDSEAALSEALDVNKSAELVIPYPPSSPTLSPILSPEIILVTPPSPVSVNKSNNSQPSHNKEIPKDTNDASTPTHEECQDIVAEPMQESSQHGDSPLPTLQASLKRTSSHDEEGIELLSPGKRPRLEDKSREGNKPGGHPDAITKVADSPIPVKEEPMPAMKDEPVAVQEDNKVESNEPIKPNNLKLVKERTEKELELVKLSQTLNDKESPSNTDQAQLSETKDDELKQDDPELQIVFSDEEDEGGAIGSHVIGGGRMLSSQMNRQIDRVQVFLKLERLRRPKK